MLRLATAVLCIILVGCQRGAIQEYEQATWCVSDRWAAEIDALRDLVAAESQTAREAYLLAATSAAVGSRIAWSKFERATEPPKYEGTSLTLTSLGTRFNDVDADARFNIWDQFTATLIRSKIPRPNKPCED